MAKTYLIDIDSYIGDWFSSKRFIKDKLKSESDKAVLCRINSLGGNLDDGIDIAAQFETHGNVTCELFSLNASAATILTTGAKTVRAHKNSFYLIHKVLAWVDEWGYMNEDDIDTVIEELKKQKNNTATLTLTVGKMYARKSGKPLADILNLMKEERWLTADEAKEWGFVDEVFEDSTVKPANIEDPELTRMINAAGIPLPKFKNEKPAAEIDEEKNSSSLVDKIISGIKEHFNPQNKITKTVNKEFTYVNSILNVEGVEFKNGKIELTEEQIKNLNEAINKADADKITAETALEEKRTEINSLNEQITTLQASAGAKDEDITKETDEEKEINGADVDFKGMQSLYDALP